MKYTQKRPYKDLNDMERCENRHNMIWSFIYTILIVAAVIGLNFLS
jgi:hypothetical protein